jgi:hypothetical protein
MVTSVGREVAPGRGKGRDDASSSNVNLTGSKKEENTHDRFNCCKLTVKI